MDMFYALAEPTRRNILEILANRGQLSATDIYENFQVSAPAISQHLKVLRESGLVKVEKQAQQRFYKINPEKIMEIEKWTQELNNLWNLRFARLDQILKSEK